MIGKYVVKLKTKFALRRNDAIRLAEGYEQAKHIGILDSLCAEDRSEHIEDFLKKITQDGKAISRLTFVGKMKKEDSYDFPHFAENHLKANGKWKNTEVTEFQQQPFDYIICLDWETNKYTRNIMAASKAKCRVGHFEEDNNQYFELMINHSDDNYASYLGQLYHYLTNMRNGQ